MQSIEIVRLGQQDAGALIEFLERPEIDKSFVRPLSERTISIVERVCSKLETGFWLIAIRKAAIIGCRGCNGLVDPSRGIVEFSTTAVAPEARGLGVGKRLMSDAIDVARQLYHPRQMRLDSTQGNLAVAALMKSLGFQVSRVYSDPSKRPPGVMSVEYVLDCKP